MRAFRFSKHEPSFIKHDKMIKINHNSQLELPLDYSIEKNDAFLKKITSFTLKKKLLNQSAWWHHDRLNRVFTMINKLNERPYSPINELRIERLRKLASVMLHRMKLEHDWHDAFKNELYEVI